LKQDALNATNIAVQIVPRNELSPTELNRFPFDVAGWNYSRFPQPVYAPDLGC